MSWHGGGLRALLGEPRQAASVREVVLRDGASGDLRAIDVRPAGGIHALVLADRGLDIGPAWAQGWPLHWQSPAGFRHPAYFDGEKWLDSFGGGLLVTCGLENVGPGCRVDDERYCQHGRFSNLPADGVRYDLIWAAGAEGVEGAAGAAGVDGVEGAAGGPGVEGAEGAAGAQGEPGEPTAIEVSGSVREASVYGVNLVLERTLRFAVGSPRIEVSDLVRNEGFEPAPLFVLYHFNLGFPLVSPSTTLNVSPAHTTESFTDTPPALHAQFCEPTAGFAAEVFEHSFAGQPPAAAATLTNHGFAPLGRIGLEIAWKPEQLRRFWQWRMLGEGMYLTGIEPANCGIRGRAAELDDENSGVDVLDPLEERRFDLTITAECGGEVE